MLRVLSSEERAFHERLVKMRNREVAHSDADVTEVTIEVFPEGHSGICKTARNPLSRPELRRLLQMIDKLESELEARFEVLREQLPNNVWL
jgi:hypothetical protein